MLVEPCEVSKLPPGLEVQYSYTDITPGSSKVSVSVKNHTDRTITIQKGTKIGKIQIVKRLYYLFSCFLRK